MHGLKQHRPGQANDGIEPLHRFVRLSHRTIDLIPVCGVGQAAASSVLLRKGFKTLRIATDQKHRRFGIPELLAQGLANASVSSYNCGSNRAHLGFSFLGVIRLSDRWHSARVIDIRLHSSKLDSLRRKSSV
jgi:hypothetical protein